MYFGAHVKASGGVWTAIEHGEALGVQAIQFFAGSPRTWKPQLYREADAARFREARAASDLRFVVIHTIYLINLATANEDFYEKSVVALVGAVTAAEQLGVDAIVTHIGSHQGAGFEAGLERVREALLRALDEVGDSRVRLLLENTAGAGGTMGVDFLELGAMIDAVGGDERLGVCLDTAHLLESGHELRTAAGLDAPLDRVRPGDRPRAARHGAPERLQDGARLQPRPPREHRRGRDRPRRLAADRQPPGVRRHPRHPRSPRLRRPGPRPCQPRHPARAAREGDLTVDTQVIAEELDLTTATSLQELLESGGINAEIVGGHARRSPARRRWAATASWWPPPTLDEARRLVAELEHEAGQEPPSDR